MKNLRAYPMISLILVAVSLSGAPAALSQPQAKAPARKASASARISWPAQAGVSRYRLHVARDQGFTDMVIDRAVSGTGYVISGLPEGRYYWRVAAIGAGGGQYSAARSVRLIKPKPPPESAEKAAANKIKKPANTLAKTTATPANTGRPARSVPDRTRHTPPAIQKQTARNVTPRRSTPFPSSPAPPLVPDNAGWRTVTGNISYPIAAHLRSTANFDLVGVNSSGIVYALDGANGAALWTTRLRLNATDNVVSSTSALFPPIIFDGGNGLANVVIAFEGGVRALEGASGAELWRAHLAGGALGGVATERIGNQAPTIFIVSGSGQELLLLSSDNGAVSGKTALLAKPFGPPVAFITKNIRNMVIVFEGGFVELRNMKGELVKSVKLDHPTTPPVFVAGPRGGVILIGTQSGLMALDPTDLRAIGRVAIEDDWPRGRLAIADLDNDGAPEVVMITNRARVVTMNTTDGKIRWEANGATDAASAAFADLNGDAVLDVLVAAWPAFAVAFSGRDGSLIWRAEEETNPAARMPFGSGRSLVTAAVTSDSNAIVAGTDSYRKGFRAVGLPRGSVRSGSRGVAARP